MLNILSNIPVMIVAASEVASTIAVSGVTGDDLLYLADTFIQIGFVSGFLFGLLFFVLFLIYLKPWLLAKYNQRK